MKVKTVAYTDLKLVLWGHRADHVYMKLELMSAGLIIYSHKEMDGFLFLDNNLMTEYDEGGDVVVRMSRMVMRSLI